MRAFPPSTLASRDAVLSRPARSRWPRLDPACPASGAPRREGVWLARAFLAALAVGALGVALWGGAPEDARLLPCPFRTVTGLECPGCGMTRALLCLAAGDPVAAWRLHPFSYALVLFAVFAAAWPDRLRRAWGSLPHTLRCATLGTILAAALAFWALRLVA